jgi:hypothetical protein
MGRDLTNEDTNSCVAILPEGFGCAPVWPITVLQDDNVPVAAGCPASSQSHGGCFERTTGFGEFERMTGKAISNL